jgi:hypothetical protein
METYEKIESIIQADIDSEQVGIDLHYKLLSILEKMEGKTISKRIETAFSKEYPEYSTYYEREHGMYHLTIWGNGIEYNDRERFLLGYESDPVVKIGSYEDRTGFLYHNCCNGSAAEERNNKRRGMLESGVDKIADIVDMYQRAHKAFHELEIESFYSIKKAFGLPDEHRRN